MVSQATVVLAVIGIYTVIVLALGYRGWQVGEMNMEDWVTADRSIGALVLTFTYAATVHSAAAFLGNTGLIYGIGLGFIVLNTLLLVLIGGVLWIVGTRLWLLGKKYDYVTPSEMMADFYDSKLVGYMASLVFIVFTFPYIAGQLTGAGIIFNVATDGLVSVEMGAAYLLVVGVAYMLMGGLRSVAWTDTAQGIYMFFAVWIAGTVIVFTGFGSPSEFWNDLLATSAAHVSFPGPAGVITPEWYISLIVTFGLGLALTPHLLIRAYSARTPRVIKLAAAGGTGYLTIFYLPVIIVALGGVLLLPELGNPDDVFPQMLFETLPAWFAATIISGAVAAAMSTKDSQLHAVASLITRDWFEEFYPDASEKTATRFTYGVVVVLALIAYVLAIQDIGFLTLFIILGLVGIAQIAPALLGALWLDWASAEGAIVGTLSGLAVAYAISFEFIAIPSALPSFTGGFYGLALNVVLFVVVSKVTDPVPDENIDQIQGYIAYARNREWEQETPTSADD